MVGVEGTKRIAQVNWVGRPNAANPVPWTGLGKLLSLRPEEIAEQYLIEFRDYKWQGGGVDFVITRTITSQRFGIFPYGGRIWALGRRVGIEDNTSVIWISDNGASPDAAPWPDKGGSNGPFRGELGDPLEGSVRTVGMIKWPGKIKPGKDGFGG